MFIIGHFRVTFYLCVKTKPSAKPFIWKRVPLTSSFSCKLKAFLKNSFWNRGTKQFRNGLFINESSGSHFLVPNSNNLYLVRFYCVRIDMLNCLHTVFFFFFFFFQFLFKVEPRDRWLQLIMIRNEGHSSRFWNYKHLRAHLQKELSKELFSGLTVGIVAFDALKMIIHVACSLMCGPAYFNSIIVALTVKGWKYWSTSRN